MHLLILKTKKRRGAYIIVSKGTLHILYASKEETKLTKANDGGRDKRIKSCKLYDRNKVYSLFPCLFIFHHRNLLNIHKNIFFGFIF